VPLTAFNSKIPKSPSKENKFIFQRIFKFFITINKIFVKKKECEDSRLEEGLGAKNRNRLSSGQLLKKIGRPAKGGGFLRRSGPVTMGVKPLEHFQLVRPGQGRAGQIFSDPQRPIRVLQNLINGHARMG
jgi:hypothetical protein